MCASEPAVVQNEVLWLTERDDNKARTLFLNHETKRIEDIENMKKAHKAKIYALIECEVAKER